MKRAEIHFVIDREGTIHSTVKRVKGAGCSVIAEKFKSLGQVTAQEQTNEFFASGSDSKIRLNLNQDE
jgi:hypothetical protein